MIDYQVGFYRSIPLITICNIQPEKSFVELVEKFIGDHLEQSISMVCYTTEVSDPFGDNPDIRLTYKTAIIDPIQFKDLTSDKVIDRWEGYVVFPVHVENSIDGFSGSVNRRNLMPLSLINIYRRRAEDIDVWNTKKELEKDLLTLVSSRKKDILHIYRKER